MIIYRIANAAFKDDISGDGASLYGARWNSLGIPVLYTAGSISLAILESIVHLKERNFPPNQYLLKIEIGIGITALEVTNEKIKQGWKNDLNYTRFIGDEFVKNNESLLLKVPSAVVEEECNYLVNPHHKDSKKVKIISSERLNLDKRLEMQ